MNLETPPESPLIGTLNEGSLHAALKNLYAEPKDEFEVPIEGYVVDILRNNQKTKKVIEIQTSSFGAMKRKLGALLEEYKIKIVYPVATKTILIKPGLPKRKSPKKGSINQIFKELVSITEFLNHRNLSFDVVLVTIKKNQEYDPKLRRNRGGYRTINTELDEVHKTYQFDEIQDFLHLLPNGLPPVFTTADIAQSKKITRQEAQQMAYCFRKTNLIKEVGITQKGKEYKFC